MNKQELIKKFEEIGIHGLNMFGTVVEGIPTETAITLIKQLDEPEPLPFKLKDVVRRIRGFDPTTQTRWLNDILKELGDDYGSMKYRSGYEQGKLEGAWVGNQLKNADKIRRELNKVKVPQFVADWIEVCKEHLTSSLYIAMTPSFLKSNNQGIELTLWIKKNEETFARAWLDGYEVEKEKRYTVVTKATKQPLYYNAMDKKIFFSMGGLATKFTRKQLEEAGFSEVFNSPLFEVEEVE